MSRRLTILAGAGDLVGEIIAGARTSGDAIQVLPLVDRSDLGLDERFTVADLPRLLWRITSFRTTHVSMVGGLRATDRDRDAFRRFARSRGATGDAALLKVAERILSMTGAKVIGAETIVPEILAGPGLIAGPAVDSRLMKLAERGIEIARQIGRLDAGQAVVVSQGRVIAVEDIAGTDALLARVAGYRREGLETLGGLVLAKALKPQQSLLVDRPAIGPQTLHNAAEAGVVCIAVEAGGAVLIDRPTIEGLAIELGISVTGVRSLG